MPKKQKAIIGFVGEIACGKGTATKYAEIKYHAETFRFSTMLRDILNRIYVPHTRDNMIGISEAIRSLYGEDVMAKTMAEDVTKSKKSLIVIDGIRRPADIVHLTKLPNFHLVHIIATPETRFNRLKQRNENEDDRTKTWAGFQADAKRSTEMTIRKVATSATFTIDNNGDLKQLQKQIDDIIKKVCGSK